MKKKKEKDLPLSVNLTILFSVFSKYRVLYLDCQS